MGGPPRTARDRGHPGHRGVQPRPPQSLVPSGVWARPPVGLSRVSGSNSVRPCTERAGLRPVRVAGRLHGRVGCTKRQVRRQWFRCDPKPTAPLHSTMKHLPAPMMRWTTAAFVLMTQACSPPSFDSYDATCVDDGDCAVVTVPVCGGGCEGCGDLAVANSERERFRTEQQPPCGPELFPPADCAACPEIVALCLEGRCELHDCSVDAAGACTGSP